MEQSDEIDQLAKALAAAQQMIEHAEKNATNPAFRSKYADLGAVIDAVKPALNGQGLSFVQCFEPAHEGHLMLTTMLMHSSGQWLRSTCLMPLAKADPQGYGSATTYARRYGLMAICGIAAEDDDGNAASAARASAHQGNHRDGRWNGNGPREESRGDAKAAAQGAVQRSERPLSVAGAPEKCPSCHAPAGKPHTPRCPEAGRPA